jgi:copper(I)-binding protein
MGYFFRVFAVSALLISSANCLAANEHLMVHEAWVREAPPNAKMLAGYFTIMNFSGKDKELVGATSDQFEKAEIHKTVQEGGMAKMIAQKSVIVPKQGTVSFKPGGLHLMLMNPRKPLKAGDKVNITLKFDKGADLKVTALVKKATGGEEHMHEHMDMH